MQHLDHFQLQQPRPVYDRYGGFVGYFDLAVLSVSDLS
jgi:hypothetical protein